MKILLRFITFATLVVACVQSVHAQPAATGVITGRVFNPATHEYIRNAEVAIAGTNRLTVTDASGAFRLDEISPGSVTIAVSFTGYRTASATLPVTAGQTVTHDFDLLSGAKDAGTDHVIQLSQFNVSTEREGNAKAIMDQRAAMNIKNVVASDIFGDVAEGNVGEFLKYLPGISLEYAEADARSVSIRGMAPKYAAVMFDGNRMASAASSTLSTGRAFEFEQVSINSVETIEVNKTIQADMDADAPAGAINFKSKSALNRKGRLIAWQLNAVGNSNQLTLRKTPGPGEGVHRKILPGGILEYSDTFRLFGRPLGVAATVSESNMYNDQFRVQNTYDNVPTAANPAPVIPVQVRLRDGPKFTERRASSLNLDYKLNAHTTLSLRSQFNTYAAESHYRQLYFFSARIRMSPLSNATTMISNAVPITTTSNIARIVLGGQGLSKWGNTGSISPSIEYKRDRLTLDANLSFSQSINHQDDVGKGFFSNFDVWLFPVAWRLERTSPDSTAWDFTQVSGNDAYLLSSYRASALSNNAANSATSTPRNSRDRQWAGQFNAKWIAPWRVPTFFKFGVKSREESFDLANYSYSWAYIGPTGNRSEAVVPVSSITLDPQKGGNIFTTRQFEFPNREATVTLFHEHPEYFLPAAANTTSDTNRYPLRFVKEQIDAAYVMGNTQLGRLTLQGGARFERTRTGSKIYERGILKFRNGDYNDIFLSGAAKYRFTKDLMSVTSVSQALLRPDFSNLTGVATINNDAMTGTIPNPELKPEHSNNYSTRLEYYFSDRVGVLAAGVFMNDIDDIQYQSKDITAAEIGLEDEYPDFIFTSWRNASHLRVKGLELEYNQQLSFLPGVLNGLSIFANYTRNLSSDKILAGKLTPRIVTGGLSYRYRGFTASLKCNWTDEKFESYAVSATNVYYRFQRARSMVDLNLSVPLSKRTVLFVAGRNIFDAPAIIYENQQNLLYQHDRFGATWTIGVKGRL